VITVCVIPWCVAITGLLIVVIILLTSDYPSPHVSPDYWITRLRNRMDCWDANFCVWKPLGFGEITVILAYCCKASGLLRHTVLRNIMAGCHPAKWIDFFKTSTLIIFFASFFSLHIWTVVMLQSIRQALLSALSVSLCWHSSVDGTVSRSYANISRFSQCGWRCKCSYDEDTRSSYWWCTCYQPELAQGWYAPSCCYDASSVCSPWINGVSRC
jgi:hypothetical protein